MLAATPRTALGEIRNGFPIIIGSMIGIGVGVASLPFYTAGAFMIPLEQSMHWSRAELSIGLAASTLMLVVGAPVSGRLADQFGTRLVAVVSLVLLALGFLSLSQIRGPAWTYVVTMGTMALLSAGSSSVTFTRAVNMAFDRARGMALGLSLMGMGVAGTFGPSFTAYLIDQYGWRAAYMGLAGLVVVAIPLVAVLVTDRAPESAVSGKFHASLPAGREWLRDRTFWIIGAGFFLVALAQSGPIAHFIPMLTDAGRSPSEAARAAGAIGASVVAGRLMVGWVLDRVFAPLVAIAIFASAGFGCLIIGLQGGQGSGAIACILGFSLGADVDLLPYITARYFGLRAYGEIYGSLYALFSVGAAAGPVVTGLVRDRAGTYAPALLGSAVVFCAACIIIARIGRYPVTEVASANGPLTQ